METPHEDPFMFQAPRGAVGPPGGGMPPPGSMPGGLPPMQTSMQQPQQPPPQAYEVCAREKLSNYVYEYLVQTGAPKAAEAFKEEVLSPAQMGSPSKSCAPEKSFLLDWFVLFWDLWSAAPERRELSDQAFSADAKYFHDSMIGMPPLMNGHHFGPPMGMDMMGGHPGAFGGRFGPGRMPPPGGMPAPGFPMFPPDPRMQRIAGQPMRMPPPGSAFPGPPGGMPRPGGPMEMPGMPRYDFMGPGGQPFGAPSGSGMMPNGGMPHMGLSSPSIGPPPGADPNNMPPNFMGMQPQNPASTSGMPFGMNDNPLSAGAHPGPGTTPGMIASVPGAGGGGAGPGSVPQVATTSVGTPGQLQQPKSEPGALHGPGSGGGGAGVSNGDEMKTEALTPSGGSGGSVGANGGPGSAPGSAHSANNNVNPATPGNPLSNPMSNPPSGPPMDSLKK
uniref:LisH domain-containing protein n=1 Tax=Caenorhabditis japonica TaxID=281687 RepID=A0A8R1HLJ8_CAEJA